MRQLVTSEELKSYFSSTRRNAQELLPLMVRRLIAATAPPGTLSQLSIPAGDDIRLPGWDGLLTTTAVHPYIPNGASAWEMGIAANPERKADADFKKRTADPRGIDPSKASFVFVTPVVWAGKQAWVDAKKAEGPWQDVRVVDGAVLSEWFDLAPAVGSWFNAERGQPVHELDDVESSWRRTIESRFGSKVTPALVIGDRNDQAKTLRAWLADPRGDLRIQAESANEVVAFVSAVAKQGAKDDPNSELMSRVLFARGESCVHYLGALQILHVLIVANPELVPHFKTARLERVSLVIPTQAGSNSQGNDGASLELPPIRRDPLEKELQNCGYGERAASRIARESRGSLDAVLWAVSSQGIANVPWLQEPAASQLAPLVLAGHWRVADKHPDHDMLARLAGVEYATVFGVATQWRGPGGPLQVWGECWDWKAWRVAWEHLAPHFTLDLVGRFKEVVQAVLGTRDPALDLPAEERWLAAVRHKSHPHSADLRGGLISSIAMFSAATDRLRNMDGRAIAIGLVRKLLDNDRLAESWLSLAQWLPDLAEAAPDAFLAAAERVVTNVEAVNALFTDGRTFGSSSAHIHVLWALERLTWNPEYLARATIILGRFGEVDPGGTFVNRPKNSLYNLFLPWHPSTIATLAQRNAAFDQLCKRCPSAAWACGLAILPAEHQTAMHSNQPHFQDWGQENYQRPTRADVIAFVEATIDRLLTLAGADPSKWKQLAATPPKLMRSVPEKASLIVQAIQGLDVTGWSSNDRVALWDTLRNMANRYETFADAYWSVSASDLEILRQLEVRFTPAAAREAGRWLFVQRPQLRGPKGQSWELEQKELERVRGEAIAKVLAEDGLAGVLSWAEDVERPESLGASLSKSSLTDSQTDEVIDAALISVGPAGTPSKRERMGKWFVLGLENTKGEEWGRQYLARIRSSNSSATAARFALALGPRPSLWTAIAADAELSDQYWRSVSLWYLDTLEQAEIAVPRLLAAGRRSTAIALAGLRANAHGDKRTAEEDDRLLKLCLLAMAEMPETLDKSELSSMDMAIAESLDFIESHSGSSPESHRLLVMWEWNYLPMLKHSQRGLRTLCRELSTSPEFFVEVLNLLYRSSRDSDSAEKPVSDPHALAHKRLLADHAWWLLQSWRLVPGLDFETAVVQPGAYASDHDGSPTTPVVTGTVSDAVLTDWVSKARSLAEAAGRLKPCDIEIGRVFAYAPADRDEAWPARPIRDILDVLQNSDIDSAMALEIRNRRGVHSLGHTGNAERSLSSTYTAMADRIANDNPRAAAILKSVASDYESDAKAEDGEGRRREYRL